MLTDCKKLLPLALALLTLPGCGTLYLAQAARGQLQVMRERRPIEAVILDRKSPVTLRAQLLEVRAARDFASRDLGLPDNGSYRTYADIRRRYVVWNVVATPEFSLEPQRWCFPIAGCVPYRGYFNENKARAFAARLRGGGLDVAIGGVPAYSTLGRLADPVLNTMLGYGTVELAAMVFHELAHQLVYIPGDAAFNEAFATAVEQEGLARWLPLRGRADEMAQYRARRTRQAEFLQLFRRGRSELEQLYGKDLDAELMRERKRRIFAQLGQEIGALEKKNGVSSGYGAWLKEGFNNAHLATLATYFECLPGFERLLSQEGRDLTRFYAAVRELGKRSREERRRMVCEN